MLARRFVRFPTALLAAALLAPASATAQTAPTPEAHFGFAMGTDRELARWDGILEYLEEVAAGSDRIEVDTLGPTTLGNPWVAVTISSPRNLSRRDEIRRGSELIARGRIDREHAEALAARLPATIFINHNIHATEIGSSQTSVELVHRLATATDPGTLEILDNVVTVLIPSANPDGQIMVTDWYYENVGTEYEGARMPWLYHHYAGHDDNRDFFQANLVETRYWMSLMYHDVFTQIYLDQHQMGSSGPRIFVPPYPDPMNPDIHPLQWQQLRFMGGGIVADLQAAGKQGVVTGAMYRIWGQESALTGRYHNIVGILTETASANLASPDTVSLEALQRGARPGRGLAEYDFQMAFVDPWPGGEWRLGDIVDYQIIAAMSVLEQAAKFREHYVLGRWQMASETIERGRREGPRAYVVPLDQDDPVAAAELADKLILQGIEVHEALAPFTAEPGEGLWASPEGESLEAEGRNPGDDDAEEADEVEADPEVEDPVRTFPAGSWLVYGAQPSRAAVLDLMEPRRRELRHEWPGGPYMRSYDAAAYTMPMQMGVEAIRIDEPFEVEAEPARIATLDPPPVPTASHWYALSARVTRAHQAVNRLLDAGLTVSRAHSGEGPVFLVQASVAGAREVLSEVADEIGLTVFADPPDVSGAVPQRAARIGVYQGWAASMDEGWTRYVLEDFDYAYESLANEDVREAGLADRLDVVIVPAEIALQRLIEGEDEDDPPEYRGGIGQEGVDNLKAFVRAGGTLVTFEEADELVLEHFGVPVRDAVDGAGEPDFFLPASILRIELDPGHALTFGSPVEVAGKWAGGRAYEPTGFDGEAGRIRAVGRWAEDPDRVLMSGMLVGAELLSGKAALLDVEYGSGRILMYGFRVQHRAQTHGTFRLLFNALLKDDPRTATDAPLER